MFDVGAAKVFVHFNNQVAEERQSRLLGISLDEAIAPGQHVEYRSTLLLGLISNSGSLEFDPTEVTINTGGDGNVLRVSSYSIVEMPWFGDCADGSMSSPRTVPITTQDWVCFSVVFSEPVPSPTIIFTLNLDGLRQNEVQLDLAPIRLTPHRYISTRSH
jgi:hypothetical protein